jgi:hypothetical protein
MGSPPKATPGYDMTTLSRVGFRVVTKIFENVVSEHMPLFLIATLPMMMEMKATKMATE